MQKIRFGIVGSGNIAHRFATACKNSEKTELCAVASRSMEKANAFGDEFGIPLRFDSYEAMAQSNDIDVAYIAVPHALHKSCSMLMMSHKKHVLCEKPIAVNSKELEEMIACARENGVFLMEAMWARFVDGTKTLRSLLDNGEIGDVLGLRCQFAYRMGESRRDHHVLKNENGGGALLDVGIYGLTFARLVLGTQVEQIAALCTPYKGTDSNTAIAMRYQNGAIAEISCATLVEKPVEGMIYGTRGMIRLKEFYAPQTIEVVTEAGTTVHKTPRRGNGFEEQIDHVCDCVAQGLLESPVHTFDETRLIMNQMDTIRKQIGIVYPQDLQ